jgi:hypothetical protein
LGRIVAGTSSILDLRLRQPQSRQGFAVIEPNQEIAGGNFVIDASDNLRNRSQNGCRNPYLA